MVCGPSTTSVRSEATNGDMLACSARATPMMLKNPSPIASATISAAFGIIRWAQRINGVATSVSELAADRWREEIARMLAGAEITEEARKAAERLMRAAG